MTIKDFGYIPFGWYDQLVKCNNIPINYTWTGNPLSYLGLYNFTWSNGRQLSTVTDGTNNYSYLYDSDNLRTQKTVNGVTTYFYWLDGVLQAQKTGDEYMFFMNDENGRAYGLYLTDGTNEEYYYFIFNLQGDVIGILDESGEQIVSYKYSPWGEVLSVTGSGAATIGAKNPIRYRGYYYDSETEFYYLKSRYYDHRICRFINADALIDNRSIITQNLFQYCGNNPINNVDENGHLFGAIIGIGLLATGIILTLSGCSKPDKKPTSTSSKPKTSSGTSQHTPTNQEKSYAATVYAEAGGQNKRTKQAVAHVMYNRVGLNSSWNDIEAVLSAKYQFEGYNSPMYQAAMDYYNNGVCNNSIDKAAMDECLAVVIPIYSGEEADFTGGAIYFHSFENPSDWVYHDYYTQVYIPGTEKFWFYK